MFCGVRFWFLDGVFVWCLRDVRPERFSVRGVVRCCRLKNLDVDIEENELDDF